MVPLMMPATHSMRLAVRPSRSALMMGMLTATAPSYATVTPCCRAAAKISLPCVASSALLAVTTCLPARMAASTHSRAGLVPPATSTTTSTSGCVATSIGSLVSAASLPTTRIARARLRAHTITSLMPRPARPAISAWLRASTRNVPEPTVPMPIMPTRSGRGANAAAWLDWGSRLSTGSRYIGFSKHQTNEQTKKPSCQSWVSCIRLVGEERAITRWLPKRPPALRSGGRGGNGDHHSCTHRPRERRQHHAHARKGCGRCDDGGWSERHEAVSVAHRPSHVTCARREGACRQ